MNHVHIDLRFKPANKWNRTSVSTISFKGYVMKVLYSNLVAEKVYLMTKQSSGYNWA